jgi:hypothetical protein
MDSLTDIVPPCDCCGFAQPMRLIVARCDYALWRCDVCGTTEDARWLNEPGGEQIGARLDAGETTGHMFPREPFQISKYEVH